MVERMEVRSFLVQVTTATYFRAALITMDAVLVDGDFLFADRAGVKMDHRGCGQIKVVGE